MPTRPDSPDPAGPSTDAGNPFATLGAGLGKGLDFFQDWIKAAGSALPHLSGSASGGPGALPGWALPTLDPAELDKRIQELKTVQFWLEQNARMIAMTIQGLEVQRMTLSTLQGMNVSMEQLKETLRVKPEAVQEFFQAGAAVAAARAAAASSPDATAASAAPAAEPPQESPAPPKSADAPVWPSATRSAWFRGVPDDPEPASEQGDAVEGGSDDAPRAADPAQAEAPGAGARTPDGTDLINPMRWWDTLTQQFSHLATQAAAQSAQLAPTELMQGLVKPPIQDEAAPTRPRATRPRTPAQPKPAPRSASGANKGSAKGSAARPAPKGRP